MKKFLIFSFIMMWLVPHNLYAVIVTEEILDALSFHKASWRGFLSEANPVQWKCGEVNGNIVRYHINGDVIGYDDKNHVWWHFITPASITMPIEALAFRMGNDGVLIHQIVILRACNGSVVQQQEEKSETIAKQVKTNVNEESKLRVRSTWEFMDMYKKQVGGE